MKPSFFVIFVAFVFATRLAIAQTWVGFHSSTPQKPETNLLESDDLHIKFQIIIPGVWVREVSHDGISYQKLELTSGVYDQQTGQPALPAITTNLGVPDGCTWSFSVNKSAVHYLSNYYIAPIPEDSITYEHGFPSCLEIYSPDSAAYNLSDFYPAQSEIPGDSGIFITQEVRSIRIFPIRFCPLSKLLEFTDSITVTVQFLNGISPAIKYLGLFNSASREALINCVNPIIPVSTIGTGSVSWVSYPN
jgi:hypothetical protein